MARHSIWALIDETFIKSVWRAFPYAAAHLLGAWWVELGTAIPGFRALTIRKHPT